MGDEILALAIRGCLTEPTFPIIGKKNRETLARLLQQLDCFFS